LSITDLTQVAYRRRVDALRNEYNASLLRLEDKLQGRHAEIVGRMQSERGPAPTTGRGGDSAAMRAAALWFGIDDAAERELDKLLDTEKDALFWGFQDACREARQELGIV